MSKSPEPARPGMSRRQFLQLGTASAAAALGIPAAARGAKPKTGRPNIVFVFSDEHRWCSLPFTEMPTVVAPRMTELASQGTRFDNCCATSPICVPYRGILITGQWPHQSSCISNDTFIDGDVIGKKSPTIAHAFKQAGYRTGYIGKWHLFNETCAHAGFDFFKHWLYGDEHWETEVRDVPSGEDFHTVRGYNATGMTNQAIEFLDASAGKEEPFLLMLSLNPPHWRWDDSPQRYYDLYPPERLPLRPNVTDEKQKSGKQFEYYRHYHGHISAVDKELGRVMDALDRLGIAEDTVLIYTSDHGSSFGSNGVHNKGNPFDESVRVPFLVRWPGKIPAGRIAEHNLGTIDLFPTLCGLAGFKAPETCKGQDFSPVFLGQDGPDPKTQLVLVNNFKRNYFHSRLLPGERGALSPFRQVRSKRYSYAVDALGEWFLFDNIADPYQLNNLKDDPARAEAGAEMARELDAWLEKAELPFIPDEWKQTDLPDRIALQNEYYSLIDSQDRLAEMREQALAPYLPDASPEQADRLRKAVAEILDQDYLGLRIALDNELSGKRRATNLPEEDLRARSDALALATRQRIEHAAREVLLPK